MAEVYKGKPVADAIMERCRVDVAKLKEHGITPALAIVRVGEKKDDISYEKGAMKRCEAAGVAVRNVVLKEDIEKEEFYHTLDELNEDSSIHGILMFRPLPKYLDKEKAADYIVPAKDIDGGTIGSLGGVFTDRTIGFTPCTAQAVMEVLSYYNIDVTGKNVVVIGRSLVIGKPVAMLLMKENATVTICHTRTKNMKDIAKHADILVCSAGRPEMINEEYVNENQIVIDVGISWSEAKNKICGDCDFEKVEPVVKAITPVPGGLGSVTTAVLVSHVCEAAMRTVK